MTAAQLNMLPIQIADSTAGASVASFDFTSIPQQFAHLKIVCLLRGDNASLATTLFVRFNNDSGVNYDFQNLLASAAAATAAEGFGVAQIQCAAVPAASATASVFGAVEILIPKYAAGENKTMACSQTSKVGTASGNLQVAQVAGFWRSTAAINRVTIFLSAGTITTSSRATIYGLA